MLEFVACVDVIFMIILWYVVSFRLAVLSFGSFPIIHVSTNLIMLFYVQRSLCSVVYGSRSSLVSLGRHQKIYNVYALSCFFGVRVLGLEFKGLWLWV